MSQLLSNLKFVVFAAIIALTSYGGGRSASGQQPSDMGAQKFEVFLGSTKTVQLDRFVEDVQSSNADVVRVAKVPGSETQVSLTGISLGSATVTVRSGDKRIVYNIGISPQPQRIYINVPENRRLTFTGEVESYNTSVSRIINVRQPDDNVLVIEAVREGRTALTVTSGNELYRYFVSTFANRGADSLEIQNEFARKGYRHLQIAFENDQAIISGTVPTQEELDDAVRIVKQYTPYVVVRAVVGGLDVDYAETEEERVIINNIKRISNLSNLIIRVKYQQPQEIRRSTFTRVAGNPALRTSVTDNETRLTTETIDLPPANAGTGLLERPIQEGTVEEITRTMDYSVPEKIFLFGELQDDLEEAKAIRIARTFCPLVVSMVTVRDPIQLRFGVKFVSVNMEKLSDTGVRWGNTAGVTTPSGLSGPLISGTAISPGGLLGFTRQTRRTQDTINANIPNPVKTFANNVFQNLTASINIDATATLDLAEREGIVKILDESDIVATNGQPATVFSGTNFPFVSSFAVSENGVIVPQVAFRPVGIQIGIFPLRYERSSQFSGEQLQLTNFGAISGDDSEEGITPNLASFMQLDTPVGDQGRTPFIDQSTKYVDENGLIGIYTLASLSTFIQLDTFAGGGLGVNFTAPRTNDRLVVNRAHLRDGQSLTINGIVNENIRQTLNKVPFFADIPVLGKLFESQSNNKTANELIVIITPQIVRMADPDENRMPKPFLPESQEYLTEQGDIPVLKRVRYDSDEVNLRPDLDPPVFVQKKRTRKRFRSHPKKVQVNVEEEALVMPEVQVKEPLPVEKNKNEPMPEAETEEWSQAEEAIIQGENYPAYTPRFQDFSTGSGLRLAPRPEEGSSVDTAESTENTPFEGEEESPPTLP